MTENATERRSALLLLLFTAVAIAWANLPFGGGYAAFWETHLVVRFGELDVAMTYRELVNDGLMAFFFFLVGLEVKREFALGELTDARRARVPIVAAALGLAVPALLYLALNVGGPAAHAWGVVISTDTAFLVGALALVGPRFPARLRVFLLTLAVVDDVGALGVIAVFYTDRIEWIPLLVAVALLAALLAVRRLNGAIRGPATVVIAIGTWFALFASGVHPTLAGVAIALIIPVFPPRRDDVQRVEQLTRAFRQSPSSEYALAATRSLRDSISPNERLQTAYGPYVSYLVLPVFALANAGVRIDGEILAAAFASSVFWGILVGLVIGKFIGITAGTWLMRVTGWGQLAPGLTVGRVAGGAVLSGIGFTISLFIVELAFADDHETADLARFAVLVASAAAFVLGWAWFRILDRVQPPVAVGAKLIRAVDPVRDHVRGPADAPLTLVEYGDYECPFCSRATGAIDEVRQHFGDELRYVWRHLPLEQVHPHAVTAARAAEAAGMQGRYFEYGGELFAGQDALEPEDLLAYAAELGLDLDQFRRDAKSDLVARRVQEDIDDTVEMDLHSTPTFFVNGVRHRGPYDAASLIRSLESTRR